METISVLIIALCTDRVDKDDVGEVDFPQHLLNASFRASSSKHKQVGLHQSIL